MTYEELNPDPFEQPYEYWLMIMRSSALNEQQKRDMLKVAGLDYDKQPSEAVA